MKEDINKQLRDNNQVTNCLRHGNLLHRILAQKAERMLIKRRESRTIFFCQANKLRLKKKLCFFFASKRTSLRAEYKKVELLCHHVVRITINENYVQQESVSKNQKIFHLSKRIRTEM